MSSGGLDQGRFPHLGAGEGAGDCLGQQASLPSVWGLNHRTSRRQPPTETARKKAERHVNRASSSAMKAAIASQGVRRLSAIVTRATKTAGRSTSRGFQADTVLRSQPIPTKAKTTAAT